MVGELFDFLNWFWLCGFSWVFVFLSGFWRLAIQACGFVPILGCWVWFLGAVCGLGLVVCLWVVCCIAALMF